MWRQIQADVLGLPLQQSLLAEQAGVGAALLAGVAEACAQVVQYGPITEPNSARHSRYDEWYHRFIELYPRLREDFHWLSKFSEELT